MARKMTNFGISDYIHATTESTERVNGNARYGQAANAMGLNESNFSLSNVEQSYKELDAEFKKITGVSSEEFMKRMEAQGELLATIGELFSSSDLQSIRDIVDQEEAGKFDQYGDNLKVMIQAGALAGYTNVISQLNTNGVSKDLRKAVDGMGNAANEMDTYKGILGNINKTSHGGTKQETKETKAIEFMLMKEIMSNVNSLKGLAGNSPILGSSALFESKAITTFGDALEEATQVIGGSKFSVAEIEKAHKKMRGVMNKHLKGAISGEFASAAQAEFILSQPLMEGVEKIAFDAVELVGREFESIMGDFSTSGFNRAGGKSIEGIIKKEFSMKSMKADAKVTMPGGDLNISRKTYNPLANKFITQSSEQSIGSMLAYAKDPILKHRVLESGGVFFNAMARVYMGHDYYVHKTDKARIKQGKINQANTSVIDTAFSGVLTRFAVALIEAHLTPGSVGMMDINGMMIPSPIYFRDMMTKLVGPSKNVNASSHIMFHQQAGMSSVEGILKSESYDADKTSGGSYRYASPALQRNIAMKSAILDNKVSVRSTFFDIGSYKSQYLKVK